MVAGRYFTFNEALEYLSVNKDTMFKLIEKGYIQSFKLPGINRILIEKACIDNFIEKNMKAVLG